MKPFFLISVLCLLAVVSCKQRASYQKPDDPLEVGRDFIRFALDGDMKMAKTFLLSNADNDRLFDKIEKVYKEASPADKEQYSTTVINCSNSLRKKNQDLKMVKTKGEWWVDFKYTFTGNQPIE